MCVRKGERRAFVTACAVVLKYLKLEWLPNV